MAALEHYGFDKSRFPLLRKHTLAMVHFYPDCMDINVYNTPALYRHPSYLNEVVMRLERQVKRGNRHHRLRWLLAEFYERSAIPPTNAKRRERFLSYYGLPQQTVLRTEIDSAKTGKAIAYYRRAIRLAGRRRFDGRFYSHGLAKLLAHLERHQEAREVCERILPSSLEAGDAGVVVLYGEVLFMLGLADQAIATFKQARETDCSGTDRGPACHATEAETWLGLIALRQGNVAEANRLLISSTDVQKCPHNMTYGFRTELAEALLAHGQSASVIRFCEKVIAEFKPRRDKDIADLLARARALASVCDPAGS